MRNVSSELRESGPCHEPESVAMWGFMSDAYQSKINFSYDACKLLSAVRQKRLFTCSVCDKLSKAGLTMPGLFLVFFFDYSLVYFRTVLILLQLSLS